jgi:hypothetical protein
MNATLAASQSTQFKIGAFDLNQTGIVSIKKITSYSELIEVDGPVLQGAAVPTVTPYPTAGATTGATSGTTSGPTSTGSASPIGGSTNSSIPSWVLGVVAVVVIVVVVAVLLLMKKRSSQPAAAPAKTKPAKSEK